jgi:hypothetical protein
MAINGQGRVPCRPGHATAIRLPGPAATAQHDVVAAQIEVEALSERLDGAFEIVVGERLDFTGSLVDEVMMINLKIPLLKCRPLQPGVAVRRFLGASRCRSSE